MHKKPIFFDPTGRRAIHVSRFVLIAGVVSTLFVVVCAISLFVGPNMDGLHLGGQGKSRHGLTGVKAAAPELLKPAAKLAAELRARQKLLHPSRAHVNKANAVHTPPPSLDKPANRSLAIGFYVNWDDTSYPSLKRSLPTLDWVIPT